MSDESTQYSTTDFYTAAVLISKNFEVVKVTTNPTNRVKTFCFTDSEELQSVVMKYVNGTLDGNIRVFKNAIENVKDLLHSR